MSELKIDLQGMPPTSEQIEAVKGRATGTTAIKLVAAGTAMAVALMLLASVFGVRYLRCRTELPRTVQDVLAVR